MKTYSIVCLVNYNFIEMFALTSKCMINNKHTTSKTIYLEILLVFTRDIRDKTFHGNCMYYIYQMMIITTSLK